ncbi:MAG TPA: STAS domain-containing protein, partial [Microthrixaceae bacterium]|nr:STAS domain-containing protein [Microthrixaceae bacterium]
MFVAVLTERPGGVVRLSVTGELDLASVPGFRRELRAAATRLDPAVGGGLVVDLTGATMVDSVGLGLLIGAARRAKDAGA